MKRILLIVLVMAMGFGNGLEAQTGKKLTRQQTAGKKNAKRAGKKATSVPATTVTLNASGSNQAFGNKAPERFSISDPLINVLNQRAVGNNVPLSPSGIVGMPKRTYGFANGKILLRNTTAITPGTSYGSGAVGTGTAIMGVGTGENAIGVNGKNPYAGPSLWGSKMPVRNLPSGDSARRNE